VRIDGSVAIEERPAIIDLFQRDTKYQFFLLTTEVGGLGLNLTSANRVIIFDPDWNVKDEQAVDRTYRLGQQNNVFIYRFITCGTMEEKVYRKQVFKGSLSKMMFQKKMQQHRYFTSDELQILFSLSDPKVSTTQVFSFPLPTFSQFE